MKTVGVDGCRLGWIAVTTHRGRLDYAVFDTATRLAQAHGDAKRIFIDIPIGLPWRDYPVRECETLARRALKERGSSVFSVPCRRAVYAASIEDARAINLAELGRSLSAQTWNICSKIAEIDRLLKSELPSLPLREVHPELAFAQLAGGKPLVHSKKSAEGIAERLALLKQYEPSASRLLKRVLKEQRRADVTADDVLDALVVYVVSAQPSSRLHTFPPDPKRDQRGIRMEIVFAWHG